MLRYDTVVLKGRLEKLSADQRRRFALSIAKRLVAENDDTRTLATVLDDVETDNDKLDEVQLSVFVYALQAVYKEDNLQDALYSSQRAYDEADSLAQTALDINLNEEGAEEKLLNHESVQRELSAQEDILRQLEVE